MGAELLKLCLDLEEAQAAAKEENRLREEEPSLCEIVEASSECSKASTLPEFVVSCHNPFQGIEIVTVTSPTT